jgi:hypothetical protein
MPNVVTNFITSAGDGFGTSLYYVTANWVIRCSGNSAGGRVPETFIRKRPIVYVTAGIGSDLPTVGSVPTINAFPREGAHNGNAIVAILDRISRSTEPAQWVSANGVAWTTAVDEIDAAIDYAQRTQRERASRRVGAADFTPD